MSENGGKLVANQRVVLVTGTSSGIGQAIAAHLVQRGWRVFGASRSAAVQPGGESLVMDVDSDASVERAVAELLSRAGRLDAVVNNAGWALGGAVEDTSVDEAKAQFETNFFGVHRVCRAVLPVLRRQGGGHVVNMSSLGGGFGMPFSGLYSASKFAVEGLTEALRLETRAFGIQVALIQPGDIRSQLPARRRYAAASGERSAYRAVFERFLAQQAKDEARAPSPERVAVRVGDVLAQPRPALRHVVAMVDQRMVVPLKRWAPHWLFERVVSGAMGI